MACVPSDSAVKRGDCPHWRFRVAGSGIVDKCSIEVQGPRVCLPLGLQTTKKFRRAEQHTAELGPNLTLTAGLRAFWGLGFGPRKWQGG